MKINHDILKLAVDHNYFNRVIALCSSGVDSIATTHYLHHNDNLSKIIKKNSELHDCMHTEYVWHVDHNYRPQNKLMYKSVKNFCRDNKLYMNLFVLKHSQNRKEFTEDYLRKSRLESFIERTDYNSQIKVNTILITGHHLDDAVESHFLNFIRGQNEFLPIPFVSTHEYGNNKITFCRPFLFNRKSDLIEYCKNKNLMQYVVEDETNLISKGSRRNMIRNEILPILERDRVGMSTIVRKIMEKRLKYEMLKSV